MRKIYYSAAVALLLMNNAAIADVAVQPATATTEVGSYANSILTPGAGNSSVLTTRTARDQSSNEARYRISLSQSIAKGTSYDPITPFRLERYETNLLCEYFRSNVSFGLIPSFIRMNTSFYGVSDTDSENSGGIIPFANYILKPSWLATIQGGYYYENHNWHTEQFAGGPANVIWRQQAHRYFGAAYITWIGPRKRLTGSVRVGTLFQKSIFEQAFDSIGNDNPARNLQRGAMSVSGRLKYNPADSVELFFQTELDYSYRVTKYPSEYRTGGGRQCIRFVAGPGVNYNPSPATEVSMSFNSVQGWGYYRENQMVFRLRILT